MKIIIKILSLIYAPLFLAASVQAHPDEINFGLLHVQGNVYMLNGGEAVNIAIQIGNDGVMLVNAMRAGLGEQIAIQIKTINNKPVRFIINYWNLWLVYTLTYLL